MGATTSMILVLGVLSALAVALGTFLRRRSPELGARGSPTLRLLEPSPPLEPPSPLEPTPPLESTPPLEPTFAPDRLTPRDPAGSGAGDHGAQDPPVTRADPGGAFSPGPVDGGHADRDAPDPWSAPPPISAGPDPGASPSDPPRRSYSAPAPGPSSPESATSEPAAEPNALPLSSILAGEDEFDLLGVGADDAMPTAPGPPDRAMRPPAVSESADDVAARQVESLLQGLVSPFPKVRGDPQLGAWTAEAGGAGLIVRLVARHPHASAVSWHATGTPTGKPAACALVELGSDRRPVLVLLGPELASHRQLLARILDDGATSVEQVWQDGAGTWWTIAMDRHPLDDESRARLVRALADAAPTVSDDPTSPLAVDRLRQEAGPGAVGLVEPWLTALDERSVDACAALLGCNLPDLARLAAGRLDQLAPADIRTLSPEVLARAEWVARPLMERFVVGTRSPELLKVVQDVLELVRDPGLVALVLESSELACAIGGHTLAICVDESHLAALDETIMTSPQYQVRLHGLEPLAALSFDPSIPPPSRARAHIRLADVARSDRSGVVRKKAAALLAGKTADFLKSLGRPRHPGRVRSDGR